MKMKKIIALILACLTVLPMLVACSEEVDTPDVVESTGEIVRDYGDIKGEYNILLAGNWEWNDYEADEASAELVDKAIYERNKTIESTYGVKLKTDNIMAAHSSTGSGTGFMKIYSEYSAGVSTYDAAMVGAYDVASLAYNGLLWDLNVLPYIDLTKDHWDQRANEDLGINSKMYYTTGDILELIPRSSFALWSQWSFVRSI